MKKFENAERKKRVKRPARQRESKNERKMPGDNNNHNNTAAKKKKLRCGQVWYRAAGGGDTGDLPFLDRCVGTLAPSSAKSLNIGKYAMSGQTGTQRTLIHCSGTKCTGCNASAEYAAYGRGGYYT